MAKVLIVEDDELIAEAMAGHLADAGFDPLWVGNGEAGITRLRYERPDVCVLDLMLPLLDGWKVIETARTEGIGTPIVVVSARGSEQDRIHALEIGADDYLVKPFSMKELVARVRVAARRGVRAQDAHRGEPIELEELRIDPRGVQAYVDGKSVELTPTEFRLLYALALELGRVLTRDELLQKIWGRRLTRRDRTVDVFVRKLRGEDRLPHADTQLRPHSVRSGLQARGTAKVVPCSQLGKLSERLFTRRSRPHLSDSFPFRLASRRCGAPSLRNRSGVADSRLRARLAGVGEEAGKLSDWQAFTLGVVQGLTELLPISSSEHLIIVPLGRRLALPGGGTPEFNKTLDVALHLGTLVAVVAYFWADILRLVAAGSAPSAAERSRRRREGRLARLLATIPAAIAGASAQTRSRRTSAIPGRSPSASPSSPSFWVSPTGARRTGARRRGAQAALGIGLAQALALMPAVSRSRVTITAGRFLRLDRDSAARLSFLLLDS